MKNSDSRPDFDEYTYLQLSIGKVVEDYRLKEWITARVHPPSESQKRLEFARR